MGIVWALLLVFEAILLKQHAGWEYSNSTIYTFHLPFGINIIFENLVVFYLFAPFMSILLFTGLAYRRSDTAAFFLMNLIIWVGGVLWEYVSMGVFKLWTMHQDRSIMPINLFGADTNLEEMLYYIPFASISVLIYLHLYYRKYHYYKDHPNAPLQPLSSPSEHNEIKESSPL